MVSYRIKSSPSVSPEIVRVCLPERKPYNAVRSLRCRRISAMKHELTGKPVNVLLIIFQIVAVAIKSIQHLKICKMSMHNVCENTYFIRQDLAMFECAHSVLPKHGSVGNKGRRGMSPDWAGSVWNEIMFISSSFFYGASRDHFHREIFFRTHLKICIGMGFAILFFPSLLEIWLLETCFPDWRVQSSRPRDITAVLGNTACEHSAAKFSRPNICFRRKYTIFLVQFFKCLELYCKWYPLKNLKKNILMFSW